MKLHMLTCVALLAMSTLNGHAAPFTIDPDRSSVTLDGSVQGSPFLEQGDGSKFTRYEGTLGAETAGGSILFGGASQAIARENGSWQPLPGGGQGIAPASYGARAAVFGSPANAAARHVEFNLISPPITMSGESFDAGQIAFQFRPEAAGTLDYRAETFFGALAGSKDLAGLATNSVGTTGTLVSADGVETLTIPIHAQFFFMISTPSDTILKVDGQLVATRPAGGGGGENFNDWIAAKFPGISDPAIIGPDADSDHDGLPNVVEHAFNLDPTAPNTGFAPLAATLDAAHPGMLALQYVRPKGRAGVGYPLLASDQLGNWLPINVPPTQVTDRGDGTERVEYLIPAPANGNQFVFLGVTLAKK